MRPASPDLSSHSPLNSRRKPCLLPRQLVPVQPPCAFEVINKRFLVPGFEVIGEGGRDSANLTLAPFNTAVRQFFNRSFNIVTLQYSYFAISPEQSGRGWEGLTIQILDAIAEQLNFTYTLVQQPDKVWGAPVDPNNVTGRWKGMIGAVQRGEYDFSIGAFSITAERQQVVDFATGFYRDWYVAALKTPEPESRIWIYVDLIQPTTWLVLTVSVVGVAFCFCLINNFSALYNANGDNPAVQEIQRPGYSVTYFAFALVTEGGNYLPATHSGRFIVTTWWLVCIVVTATYTGNLVARLAVSVINLPFQSLEELSTQSEYRWTFVYGAALATLMENSSSRVYRKLYQDARRPLLGTYAEGYSVLHDKTVFLTDQSWVEDKKLVSCNITELSEKFFPSFYGWAFPKGSPLTDVFSESITQLLESGIIQRWTRGWVPQGHCVGAAAEDSKQSLTVSLETVSGAFIILGLGVVCAVACLGVEQLWVRLRAAKNRTALSRRRGAESGGCTSLFGDRRLVGVSNVELI